MRHNLSPSPNRRARDAGNVLPLVLVISVVLSVTVIGLANYVTTGLRYGSVVEGRADRLAAADGGMRYAVERLGSGASRICATAGGDTIDPPDINGATVTVTCSQVGSGFDDITGWALVLTGEGAPPAAPLIESLGAASDIGKKFVGGPVYMNRLNFNTPAQLEFQYSQLLYTGTGADCSTTPAIPANVTFDSESLGIACTPRPWSHDAAPTGMFSQPNIGPLPTNMNPAPSNVDSCKVFVPGHYTVAPVLGSNNYFRSGNYIFDGFNLEIKNATVTAGYRNPDGSDGSTQFITNTACNAARNSDPGIGVITAGVTFYMQNGASFELTANGKFEVMRRKQGKSYVSVHVLDNSYNYDDSVILQGSGSNKDMVLHGLIWAPEARVTFSNVSNVANGQILGGAALSNVILQASASSVGFIIAVEPSDLHGKLQLDSVAELNGKTTTIRSIVDYRATNSYTAVTSWRVID
jgi:Tfp pilus assembly protein PilX